MDLFYTPEYAKTGDVIPFFDPNTNQFENFYLKNWNPDAPKDKVVYGWHRITTKDNRSYEEMPVRVHGGTGSVLYIDGLYHMFYCTFDRNPPAQWVRHATSKDLIHWDDIPEEKFGPDGIIYRSSDWRDPFVFWNEEEKCWWMLLAARENARTERNGCVALCVSDDLKHWEIEKPIYAPRMHQGAYECPDMFQIGDWYYLVYSSYTDGFSTYYRMSKSPRGPWIRPAIDTFDGRAFYAAKTGSDGKNRYIYGWNPTRGENSWSFDPGKEFGKDYKSWNWGGSIVVHKILQHADGTLGVCPVESVENAFVQKAGMSLRPLTGQWTKLESQCAEPEGQCTKPEGQCAKQAAQFSESCEAVSCVSEDGYSALLGNFIPRQCCIKLKCSFQGKGATFGVALQVDERFDKAYYLMFEPKHQRIQFRSGLRMYEQGGQMFPYAVEMERPLTLEEGREYELEIYIQDTIGVLYVNHDLAFGFRMYNEKGKKAGFFVSDGSLMVKDAAIWTE